jgi:pectin methylesterase-like acyl-CoA thioesterase
MSPHLKIQLHEQFPMKKISFNKRAVLACLLTFAFCAQSRAQNIFVQFPTSGGAGTAAIAAPAGNTYSAGAPVSGTSWNTFGESTIVVAANSAAGTYTLYNNSALVNSVGTGITPTLTISLTEPVVTSHANPSTASGENTIQPGGVMKGAWRNYNNSSSFYYTYAIAGLPASTPFGLYVYGGTATSGQGAAINLTNSANWLGGNPTNLVTLNTNLNSAASAGAIWTVSGGTTNLMPQLPTGSIASGTQTNGGAWGVLYGQSDPSGNFIFRLGAPAPTGTGNGAYINGFQLVPLSVPSLTGPTNQTVIAGNSTTLSATAGGLPAPTFQWQTNGVNVTGATNSSLALNNVQYAQNGYVYSLIATNTVGAVTNSMTLMVVVTPSVTGLPGSYATNFDDDVTFSPSVAGVPTPTLQWQFNGNNLTDGPTGNGSTISGSTSSTFTITNAQTADSGVYSLIASNAAGIVTNSVTLTISSGGSVSPSITGPTDQTVVQTSNATFTASVSGLPVPALQWLQNGTNINGATTSSLTLNNVQYSQNGYVYSLVASNSAGMATNSATLYVLVPPTISIQPTNLVVTNTQNAAFSVTAGGVPSPAYQWYFNGSLITNATSAIYTIASASPTNIGSYSVIVTNSVGSVTSSVVTLTVNSTMAVTTLSPTNGATGICYDTPLYITFSQTPVARSAGTIKIYNVTNSVTPVDTIDLSLNNGLGVQARSLFPGDSQAFNYYPVIITGTTAAIYPHSGVMTSNQTYYVTVDDGAFADGAGAYFAGIAATNVWQFTTKPTGPANPTNIVVAQDYSGDFATVQGAVDSLPLNNANYALIKIQNGNYVEIVDISGKSKITFRGQSRAGTVVGYANNANIAPGGTTHARMAFKVNANNIAVENMTVTNRTPVGGSQAEALMIETGAGRFILNNANVGSYQDTLLANVNSSQGYFYNSLIEGQFDYIWGGGNLFFTNCELRTLLGAGGSTTGGNLTASRTDNGATGNWLGFSGLYVSNGFSFVECQLTRANNTITSTTLADGNGTANGLAAWINCSIDANYITPAAAVTNSQILWEYGNSNLLDTAAVSYGLIDLTNNDPRLLAARNATNWLNGWVPQLSPNILTNPMSQSISGGGTATFIVVATGIPDPTYQWLSNSSPISGQTGSSLTISSANANNAGSYSVIVSNSAGVLTSSNASLTVGNTAPTFTPVSDQTVNVGVNVSVANVATDPDVPAQTLTFSLLTGQTGAAVNSSSGNFTWRPTVSFAGTTNPVKVVVIDNGTPNLSATNSFNVIVNPLTPPVASALAYFGGQFSVNVSGQVGPDYELQATTNLADGTWVDIATTNSPTSPFTLTDTNAAAQPVQFYRIVAGPPLP